MKHRLLVAFLAVVGAACSDKPQPPRTDGGADARPADSNVPVDASPADTQRLDTATDAGADRSDPAPDTSTPPPDTATMDTPNSDAAAPDVGPDLGRDSADVAPDAGTGVTCGAGAPRDMLCETYCDGIGRFCTRGDTQYRNADECRAACNAPTWACGRPGETTGNTLFCRLAHMALAGVGAAATECPNAGPNSPTCK
jgi:hypothetical protein